MQLVGKISAAGAQRGLLWVGGGGSGRRALLLLLWVCDIGRSGRASGALPLLQLLVPPVGCDIGRSAGTTLCACLLGGIIRQWGPAERCLTRPLLSTPVLRCLRLPVGLVSCSWRRGLPKRSLPLLLVGGLWGMGWSLDLLVGACSRVGGLGSRTLTVLRPEWSLWDLRIWERGWGHPGSPGVVQGGGQHALGLAAL